MNLNRPLIIMGNGPSLKDVDFDSLQGFDTFGLNAVYRAYRKMNWYPTYFGCFDYIVNDSHRPEFTKLIKDKSNGIEKFFFLRQFHMVNINIFHKTPLIFIILMTAVHLVPMLARSEFV